MSIQDLAAYIRNNKQPLNYPGRFPLEDGSVVIQQTRHEMGEYIHLSDQHIFECCEKANSFEEHLELCRPLAKSDTEEFRRVKNAPPPKGRTRPRFRYR